MLQTHNWEATAAAGLVSGRSLLRPPPPGRAAVSFVTHWNELKVLKYLRSVVQIRLETSAVGHKRDKNLIATSPLQIHQ